MAGMEDWLSVARANDPDDVRERILTGYRDGKPFTPYVPTVALPAPIDRVLDFGCGLGRNFPHLTSIAREVVGFDLPPMIERCRTLGTHAVALLTSDWQEATSRSYDLIVATLVLQHIETAACAATSTPTCFSSSPTPDSSRLACASRSTTIRRRTSFACWVERRSTRFVWRPRAGTTR